jgi:hypothetical protein
MAVKRWNGTSWEIYAGSDLAPVKVTDGRVGKTTFIGATTPTGMVDGDIWIDQDTATNAVVPTALLAKGDIFVATASGSYTRLAAGNNGESLYADSTASTGLRWQGDFNTGKNKILNGDFSIWQRGTSFTPGGGTTYSADRCFHYWDGNGSHTISRQTFTPGSAPVAGYEGQYFFRHQQTTAGTGGTYMAVIGQLIEDVRTLAGQTVTFSFWAKADAARTYVYFFDQGFGTGGSASVNAAALSVPMTTSWQRFTYTFNMPSVSGKTIGPNSCLSVRMDSNAVNTTQTIDIWGIQLEAGSVATPFTINTANQQAELAACQRYYQKSYNTDVAPGTASNLSGIVVSAPISSTVANGFSFGHVPLKVEMRAAPSVVIYSFAGTVGVVSNGTPSDLAANSGGVNTAGTRSFSMINNSGGTLTSANGSIIFHYVASAEL